MEPKYCLNCGAEVSSKFCGSCGAKYSKKEVDLKSLLVVVIETITNWEQKMLITLKYLFTEPSRIPWSYIHGERRKYFHPVKFVMFWAGMNVFLAVSLHYGLANENTGEDKLLQKTFEWLDNYYAIFWLVCIPLISIAPFLFFRKLESKFLHHCVIMCYMVGMNLIIGLPSIIINGIFKIDIPIADIFFIVLPLSYSYYTFRNYFHQGYLKTVLCVLLMSGFLFLGLILILMILYLILMFF